MLSFIAPSFADAAQFSDVQISDVQVRKLFFVEKVPIQSGGESLSEVPTQPRGKPPSKVPIEPEGESPSEVPSQPGGESPSEVPSPPGGESPSEALPQLGGESPSEAPPQPRGKPPSKVPIEPEGESPSEVPSQPGSESPSEVPSPPGGESPSEALPQPGGELPSEVPSSDEGNDDAQTEAQVQAQARRARRARVEAQLRAAARASAAAKAKAQEEVVASRTEGEVRSSTADYDGAIEIFTEAIILARKAHLKPRMQFELLMNLGEVRLRAFRVHGDVGQLLAAREILEHCLLFTKEHQIDLRKDERDYIDRLLVDVEININSVRRTKKFQVGLNEHEIAYLRSQLGLIPGEDASPEWESMTADTTGLRSRRPRANNDRRRRSKAWWSTGVALSAGLTATGVGLIVFGSTIEDHARKETAKENKKLGVSPSDEQIKHIEDKKREGVTFMAVGAATAAIGVTSVILTALALDKVAQELQNSRSRARVKSWRPAFSFSGRGFGLSMQGRF